MSFSLDLKAFAEKVEANAETVIKKVAIDLLSAVVDRSPVGNPEIWAANLAYRSKTKAVADAYDAHVDVRNANISLDPSNFTRGGNLKRGVKYAKHLTKAERDQNFDVNGLVAGKDYVGGRFRGNWQVSFDKAKTGTLERIDPSGAASIGDGTTVIQGFTTQVGTIWMMNNLPYAQPLEYGHSAQAPAGMVRISVLEVQMFITKAISELP
ncbi:hypothetical protein [Pseudomonas sp. SDO55104_S430]